MTAPRAGELRDELTALLAETDPHRPLDSLESVVVRSYLRSRNLAPAVEPGDGGPDTIEGWLTWAVRRSPDS